MSTDTHADDASAGRSDIAEKLSETRQRLARTAESLAQTFASSADVHADMAPDRPDALEHAERDRRLAAAEDASAAALHRGDLPPSTARRTIRAGGREAAEHDDAGTSAHH